MVIGGYQTFTCVVMHDFLKGLAAKIEHNSTALDNYRRMYLPQGETPRSESGSPLQTKTLFKHVQVGQLSGRHPISCIAAIFANVSTA